MLLSVAKKSDIRCKKLNTPTATKTEAGMRHQLILKYIERIAKTGSLRSAADELSITPSALNRRILSVEEELGVEIFERHPSGLRPNIAG